jgi:hypothetical protein
LKKVKGDVMTRIELSSLQREQMAGLIEQLNKTRTVAEAFVGYFAKELGVNLQLYQFNADSLSFEPVGGYTSPAASSLATQAAENVAPPVQEPAHDLNGKVLEEI